MAGLNLRVNVNVLQATRELRSLGRALGSVGKAATATQVQTSRAARAVTALGTAAGTAAGLVLNLAGALAVFGGGAAAVSALKFSADFEKSLAEINTILGEGGVSIDRYREQLLKLSTQSSKTLDDLSRGLYQTISSGIPTVEGAGGAFDVLTAAQRAAVAGLSSTEDAVDAVVSVMNAYGSETLTSTEITDQLTKTVQLGRVRFSDLAKGIGRVTTIAAQANVPLEDILAVLVQLTRQGIKPAEAITGLRNILKSLINPTKQTKDFLEAFNGELAKTGKAQVEFGAEALSRKGLIGVLRDLTVTTGGSSTALTKLFPNIRALIPGLVAVGEGFDDVVGFQRELIDSSGFTVEAFQKIDQTLSETFAKFISNLGAVAVQVTEGPLVELTNFLRGLNEQLSDPKAIESFKGTVNSLIEVFRFLGDAIKGAILLISGGALVKVGTSLGAIAKGSETLKNLIPASLGAFGSSLLVIAKNATAATAAVGSLYFLIKQIASVNANVKNLGELWSEVDGVFTGLLASLFTLVDLFARLLFVAVEAATRFFQFFGVTDELFDPKKLKEFLDILDIGIEEGLLGIGNELAKVRQEFDSATLSARRFKENAAIEARRKGFASPEEFETIRGSQRAGSVLDVGAIVDEKTIARTSAELKFLGDELFNLQTPIELFASQFESKGKDSVSRLTPVVQKFFLDFEAGTRKSALSAVEVFARLEKEINKLGTVTARQAEGVAFLSAEKVLLGEILKSREKIAQIKFLGANAQNAELLKEQELRLRNLELQRKALNEAKTKVSAEREAAEAIAKGIEDKKKQDDLDKAAARRRALENQLLSLILEAEKDRLKISQEQARLFVENERSLLRDLEIEERLNRLRISGLNEELKRRKLIRFEIDRTTGEVETILSQDALAIRKNLQDAFKDQAALLEERRDQLQVILAAELEQENNKLKTAEKNEEISLKKRVAKLKKLEILLRGDSRPAETIEQFKQNLDEFKENIAEASNLAGKEFGQELQQNLIDFQEETNKLRNEVRSFNEDFVKEFFNSQRRALQDFERIEKLKNKIFLDGIRDRDVRQRVQQQVDVIAKVERVDADKVFSDIRKKVEAEFKGRSLVLGSLELALDEVESALESGLLRDAPDIERNVEAISKAFNGLFAQAQRGEKSLTDVRAALDLIGNTVQSSGLEGIEDLRDALRNVGTSIDSLDQNNDKEFSPNKRLQELIELTVAERFEVAKLGEAIKQFKTDASEAVGGLVDDTRTQIGTLAFDINAIFQNLFGSLRVGLDKLLDQLSNRIDAGINRVQFNISKFFQDETIDIFGQTTGPIRENAELALQSLKNKQQEIARELDRSQKIIATIEGTASAPVVNERGVSKVQSGIQSQSALGRLFKDRDLDPSGLAVEAVKQRLQIEKEAAKQLEESLEDVQQKASELEKTLSGTGIGKFFAGLKNIFLLGYPEINKNIAEAETKVKSFGDVSEKSVEALKTKFFQAKNAAELAANAFFDAQAAASSVQPTGDPEADLAAQKQFQAAVQEAQKKALESNVELRLAENNLLKETANLESKNAAEKELQGIKDRKGLAQFKDEFTQPFKDAGNFIVEGFESANEALEDVEGFEDLVPEGLFEGALEGFGEEFASFGAFLDQFVLSAATILTNITTLFGEDGFVANIKSIGSELLNVLESGAEFLATATVGAFKLGVDILKTGLDLAFDLFLTTLTATLAPIGTAVAAPLQRLFGSLDSAVSVLADVPDEEDEKRFQEKSLEIQRAQLENIRLRGQEDISNEELARVQGETFEALEEEETALERLANEIDRAMEVAVNIAEQLGPLVATFLEKVTEALPIVFPKIVKGLTEALAAFAEGFPALVITLTREIVKALPDILDAIINLLPALVTGFIGILTEILKELPTIVIRLIDSIVENIPLIIDALIEALPDFIEALALAVPEIIGALVAAIPRIIGALIMALPRLIVALIRAVPLFIVSLARGFGRYVAQIFRPFASAIRVFTSAVRSFAESVSSEGGASIFGAILGGAAGLLLAPVTGGASLAVAAAGAGVGAGAGYGLAQLHTGGNITGDLVNKPLANMFRLAGVEGFLDGGMVGDTLRRRFRASLSDDVPAILQTGEAVLSRRGVAAIGGPSAVDNINSGQAGSGPVSVNVGINPSSDGLQSAAAALLPLLVGSIGVNVNEGGRRRTRTQPVGNSLLGYRTVPGVK